MLDLISQYFKAAIINIIGELKQAILTELRKDLMTMSHQIRNINKEIEIIK